MPRIRRLAALSLTAACTLTLAACGSSDSSGSGSGLEVVATTTQLGDIVRNVGGDRVDVHQVLQPNTDPHEYEPRPADLTATTGAKVVFTSGDGLDSWMADVTKQSGADATTVDVGSKVPDRLPGEGEHEHEEEGGEHADEAGHEEEAGHDHAESEFDPHWWHDPKNVEAAIPVVRDALIEADPSAKDAITASAAAYLAKVRRLDAGMEKCLSAVPAARRNLVTSHDAFNYLAHRFDITVVGAVIPSQTTQAQPSAASIRTLAAQVKRTGTKAIFPETSVNPKLADALAKETGARADLKLYGDTLGPKDSAGGTYVGMEQANADALVKGFTGSGGCAIAGL